VFVTSVVEGPLHTNEMDDEELVFLVCLKDDGIITCVQNKPDKDSSSSVQYTGGADYSSQICMAP
jgi:hypothetical protein